jgi:hypothetical protein
LAHSSTHQNQYTPPPTEQYQQQQKSQPPPHQQQQKYQLPLPTPTLSLTSYLANSARAQTAAAPKYKMESALRLVKEGNTEIELEGKNIGNEGVKLLAAALVGSQVYYLE